jgi:hypothetical protein
MHRIQRDPTTIAKDSDLNGRRWRTARGIDIDRTHCRSEENKVLSNGPDLMAGGRVPGVERVEQALPSLRTLHHDQQLALAAGGLGVVARVSPSSAASRKHAGSLGSCNSTKHTSQIITSLRFLVAPMNTAHSREPLQRGQWSDRRRGRVGSMLSGLVAAGNARPVAQNRISRVRAGRVGLGGLLRGGRVDPRPRRAALALAGFLPVAGGPSLPAGVALRYPSRFF